MKHGTLTAAITHKCRCDECRRHHAKHQKRYRADYDRGRRRTIPADRAAAHLQTLLDAGMSWWSITEAGGWRSRNSVYRIWCGDTSRVTPAVERRILAITCDLDRRPQVYVPADGPRNRLRSLQSIGWPYRELASMLGMDESATRNILGGKSPRMRRATARKIDVLWERLWDQPGPSDRSRRSARRRGWPMPLDLEPVDGADATWDGCPRCEDIRWLRESGETDAAIAARLGYSRADSVENHLSRCARKAGAA